MYWSWKYSRLILQDQDQHHNYQDWDRDLASQDQDHIKLVSNILETETTDSRTTSLMLTQKHPTAAAYSAQVGRLKSSQMKSQSSVSSEFQSHL